MPIEGNVSQSSGDRAMLRLPVYIQTTFNLDYVVKIQLQVKAVKPISDQEEHLSAPQIAVLS